MKKGGAAKGELVLAMYELANSFRHGWGVDMDPVAARSYYETAANLGDTDAMNEVARCYEEGFGGKKDKVRFLDRAIRQWKMLVLGMLWDGARFQSSVVSTILAICFNRKAHGLSLHLSCSQSLESGNTLGSNTYLAANPRLTL